jgi:enoyl-CoA hydratase/carnithine racemase
MSTSPASPHVETAIADGVHTLRFARPEKKNALIPAMYAALVDALRAAERDPAVAAHVFLGTQGAFTAGNDIGDFAAKAMAGGDVLDGPVLDFLRLLPAIEKPMLAAVDGLAIGIGTTLLMHCDLVYVTPHVRLQTPFLDLGLVPEAGSSLLAPRIMGHVRAFELLVLGEAFGAEQAQAAGLVTAIVAPEALEPAALAAARRLAAKPRVALRAARRLLRGDPAEVRAAIDTEARLFAERLASAEAQAAFRAFFARRG